MGLLHWLGFLEETLNNVRKPTPANIDSYVTIRDVGYTTRRAASYFAIHKSSKILTNEDAAYRRTAVQI